LSFVRGGRGGRGKCRQVGLDYPDVFAALCTGLHSSVPLTHQDPRDLGLICVTKRLKIRLRVLSDSRVQSWIFLKKRTLSLVR